MHKTLFKNLRYGLTIVLLVLVITVTLLLSGVIPSHAAGFDSPYSPPLRIAPNISCDPGKLDHLGLNSVGPNMFIC